MTTVLFLQAAYGVAGFLFNLVSQIRAARGQGHLTPTPPKSGMMVMSIVVLVTLSYFVSPIVYVIGWIALVVFLGRGGVATHARALAAGGPMGRYASRGAAITAMVLNIFGVAMGVLGLVVVLAGAL